LLIHNSSGWQQQQADRFGRSAGMSQQALSRQLQDTQKLLDQVWVLAQEVIHG